ncbi:MAG TPA: hypothetical protein PKL83_06520 [bacterium]|nr:hypothetical protein [bacterium]
MKKILGVLIIVLSVFLAGSVYAAEAWFSNSTVYYSAATQNGGYMVMMERTSDGYLSKFYIDSAAANKNALLATVLSAMSTYANVSIKFDTTTKNILEVYMYAN